MSGCTCETPERGGCMIHGGNPAKPTPAPVLDVSPLQTWGNDFTIPDTDGNRRAIRVVALNEDEVEMLVGMYYYGIQQAKKDGTWPK